LVLLCFIKSFGVGWRVTKTTLFAACSLWFIKAVSDIGWASVNASVGGDLMSCSVGMFWMMCGNCLLGLGVGHSWWVGCQVCAMVNHWGLCWPIESGV